MFAILSNGWELAKQSWRVLKLDKELLIFPLLSGIACLAVLASFALPLWGAGYLETLQDNQAAYDDPVVWVAVFAYYFLNYFVIVYFNSALVACSIIRFKGGDPTVMDGLRAATARLPQIAGWALVAASVGMILHAIESRSRRVGQIVAGLMGMAWSAATYFVVPVLVVEKVGPGQAIKRSLSILRRAWGEALVANFGIGLIVFLAVLVALIPAAIGFLLGSVGIFVGIAATVLLLVLVALISSALSTIIIGALYHYATRGSAPGPFQPQHLRAAFVAK